MIYLIITLAMGLLVPIQTAANSRLRMTALQIVGLLLMLGGVALIRL